MHYKSGSFLSCRFSGNRLTVSGHLSGEDDCFPDYPYRFVGKTSEVTHFCVALCACRKLEGVSGKINLPQLVKDTCRLLNIKVPDRPDLLVERVFNCKNRFLNLDRFCRKYKEEVQKGN